ncbi:MAG: M20/M25/M40 family metallo-hydrolase [Bacteroidales bacterium]|nr:M20/M25/M40 family metallo-hydrolase [Bacteroidales bacterium]MCF8406146.1 M20/M25/M40 family metallo-hydrolase [Bacteroidales bacterium]
MKFLGTVLIVFLSGNIIQLKAQESKTKGLRAITQDAVEAQLEFLSSDWTQGRATGTEGAYLAADYIASMFKVYGLEPAGDEYMVWPSRIEQMQGKKPESKRNYFQSFELLEYSNGESQFLSLINTYKTSQSIINFTNKVDFRVDAGSVARAGSSDVIFVGYGYANEDEKYDDFSGVDISNKIIIRLSGFPGHSDSSSVGFKRFAPKDRRENYYLNRNKNSLAEEKGALAILELNMEEDVFSSLASNIPFRYNSPLFEGDVRQESFYDTRMTLPGDSLKMSTPVFYISNRMANEILEGSGINLQKFIKNAANSPTPGSKKISKNIQFETSVNSKIIKAQNVVGVLEGKDKSEIIVVGAHYDHLGMHDGYIWNGADDNASGTVGVMTIAKACMATGEKPEKTIVFAAWTGEEKGLLGSKYFVDHPFNNKKIILNLNYDMISRDDADDSLGIKSRMSYHSDYPEMEKISLKNIKDYKLNMDVTFRPSKTASGGSDHAPFAAKSIPYFYFMAGFPPEYHQSNDHIELVNFEKMSNIIRLGYLDIWDFANSDNWRK